MFRRRAPVPGAGVVTSAGRCVPSLLILLGKARVASGARRRGPSSATSSGLPQSEQRRWQPRSRKLLPKPKRTRRPQSPRLHPMLSPARSGPTTAQRCHSMRLRRSRQRRRRCRRTRCRRSWPSWPGPCRAFCPTPCQVSGRTPAARLDSTGQPLAAHAHARRTAGWMGHRAPFAVRLADAPHWVASPSYFVTFWSLSLYDIFVPEERYKEQASKLRAAARELETASSQGRVNREAAQVRQLVRVCVPAGTGAGGRAHADDGGRDSVIGRNPVWTLDGAENTPRGRALPQPGRQARRRGEGAPGARGTCESASAGSAASLVPRYRRGAPRPALKAGRSESPLNRAPPPLLRPAGPQAYGSAPTSCVRSSTTVFSLARCSRCRTPFSRRGSSC